MKLTKGCPWQPFVVCGIPPNNRDAQTYTLARASKLAPIQLRASGSLFITQIMC